MIQIRSRSICQSDSECLLLNRSAPKKLPPVRRLGELAGPWQTARQVGRQFRPGAWPNGVGQAESGFLSFERDLTSPVLRGHCAAFGGSTSWILALPARSKV